MLQTTATHMHHITITTTTTFSTTITTTTTTIKELEIRGKPQREAARHHKSDWGDDLGG